jgi:uncharacterized protein YidB (DUF937 family)
MIFDINESKGLSGSRTVVFLCFNWDVFGSEFMLQEKKMKYAKIAGISAIVVLALAVLGVTLVFAQNPDPSDTPWWRTMQIRMQGSGMMGGNWESMQKIHSLMTQNGGIGVMHQWMHQSGGVHETTWKALADQLGLTNDEITAQISDGKTLAQLAEEKGVSTKDLAATMENSMKSGLAKAVENGVLTQEQADVMLQQMDGRYEWMITNMGAGMMGTGGGMMGPGSGGCHDVDQSPNSNSSL